ncbi:hypothetical protein BJX64DRAFT_264780 [Aspergillus heterothallicus]
MHSNTHLITNTAETWCNRCGVLYSTRDDGLIVDPKLPTPPDLPGNPVTSWDYAPDFLNPPFPSVANEDESPI